MDQATTQINVRIASDAKHRGDRALSAAHISPSRALRALWSYCARHQNEPEAISRMIAQLENSVDAQVDEHAQAVLAESDALVQASTELMGLSGNAALPPVDDRQLLEQAFSERYTERGLL